jgi:hypothetical protein
MHTEVFRHLLPDDDAQDLDVLHVGRESVLSNL